MKDVNFITTDAKAPVRDTLDVKAVGFDDQDDGTVRVAVSGATLFTFSGPDDALGFAHALTLFLGEPIAGRIQVNEHMHAFDVIFPDAEGSDEEDA